MRKIILHILLIFIFVSISFAQKDTRVFKRQAITQIKVGKYGEAIALLNKYVTANP